jgi:hypothetical protein
MAKKDFQAMKEWIANEEEIAKILPHIKPLLEKREQFEKANPELKLVREPNVGLEKGFSKITSPPTPDKTTILRDSGSPIPGEPPRNVPSLEGFRRRIKRRREKERKLLKEAKKQKRGKLPVEEEKQKEDLMDKEDSSSSTK